MEGGDERLYKQSEAYLSKAAFADNFEVVKIRRFDPDGEVKTKD